MKKLLALLLCLVMVVSLFAGCGGGNDTPDTTAGEGSGDENLNKEDITITIGIPQSAKIEDYDLNAYSMWLEEASGYDIEFKLYQGAVNDYKSQLSVSLVDGENLPDILMGFSLGTGYYNELGEDGYFIDLAPYFNDKEGKAKVWWDRVESMDQPEYVERIWRNMLNDDGESIYVFPTVEYSPYDVIRYQMFINQDWLDKCGKKMPTNIDELYDVLVAFNTMDPNGNGNPNDEIPAIGLSNSSYANIVDWIINMFLYHDDGHRWRVDENGKIYHNYASQEYRDALIFINKLVKEGLLHKTTWTTSMTSIKNMLAPGDNVQTLGIFSGHPTLVGSPENANLLSYVAMPYWGYAVVENQKTNYETFITEDCENPDAAWDLLMTMCSEESAYRQRYGVPGVDYVEADEGAVSFLGWPAEVKVVNEDAFTGLNNSCWHRVVATVLPYAENETCQVSEDMTEWIQHKMKIMTDCYNNYYAVSNTTTPDNIVQNVRFTTEEEEQNEQYKSNTTTWISECRATFCTGEGTLNDPNNDAQWKAYVDGLTTNGINEWMTLVQTVYDRQNG